MDQVIDRVRHEAVDGRLPCERALEIAEELGVPPRKVGEAADRAGVKITACQLGCFD